MPSPRLLLVTDLSHRTRDVLAKAKRLRRRWGVTIDVYYLWSIPRGGGASDADLALAALQSFAHVDGAWDTLDELGAKERAGDVAVRGYVTPSRAGRTILELAFDAGYLAVLDGTDSPATCTAQFEMRGAPSPGVTARSRPLLTFPAPRRASSPRTARERRAASRR